MTAFRGTETGSAAVSPAPETTDATLPTNGTAAGTRHSGTGIGSPKQPSGGAGASPGNAKPKKTKQFGVALGPESIRICIYAVIVGFFGGLIAQGLLELIYLLTNIFFFGRFSFVIPNPALNHLGLWVMLIPPIGGAVVGIMVYYWEPTLKGHGIPEAMEAVLFGRSRMRLRVVLLKPLATAFAIGTGGPFDAEGPIIQTGAAVGALFGQAAKLSPYYRRVLLASGAAAGMAATFTAPLAGVLVAIELLLFEFRAKSFIPVAFAATVATAVRIYFVGGKPLFPAPAFALHDMNELWLFALLGVVMGIIGIAIIRVLFRLEDFFDGLPLKRALIWSPIIGAFLVGVIGYFYPQIFGTSYSTIRDMLNDRLTPGQMMGISMAKFWALTISLGSGTTGGVFAPSLVIGGGVGAAFAMFWHHFLGNFVSSPGLYALAAMGAGFGCIARAPFSSIVFLFELSHNPNSLLPLIVCVMVADLFVRLFNADSVMTGKLVRRGLIVLQDYSVPVLMRYRIDDIMRKKFTSLPADAAVGDAIGRYTKERRQLMTVVEPNGALAGIVEPRDLLGLPDPQTKMRDVARQDFVIAHPGDLIDKVSRGMILKDVENIVIVEPGGIEKPIGIARAKDILQLRRWVVDEESREEAPLGAKTSRTSRVKRILLAKSDPRAKRDD